MTSDVAAGVRDHRLLLVEDSVELSRRVAEYLQSHNLDVSTVDSLAAARELLRLHRFDIVVLDLNLGSENGLDLARELATQGKPPVIITSARVEETGRVVGLEIGADDYLVKPYSFRDLLARIGIVVRRASGSRRLVPRRRIARFATWSVDLTAHRAQEAGGRSVDLTSGELGILRAFLDHPHRVLVRHELTALTRRVDAEVLSRTIGVLITRLRRKFEADPKQPQFIRTVRGEGYAFEHAVTWEFSTT